jgi:hypothetical protein
LTENLYEIGMILSFGENRQGLTSSVFPLLSFGAIPRLIIVDRSVTLCRQNIIKTQKNQVEAHSEGSRAVDEEGAMDGIFSRLK